ncbi:MAG: CHAD domain-containing protein [Beijerinckiaceae bacterium]|nr:CHAD domain-containing protein [Beijerinckiaceae bacterium]MCI0737019.1 CHAD domain-containing protein [Beijerinckiaceae bacterium]
MTETPEIELKFLFAEKDLPKVKELISANAKKVCHHRLRTVYFDTPEHDLWNHGFTLRVRASGDSYLQGIKRILSSSVQREEWEEEISGPEPDMGRINSTPLAQLAAEPSICGALRPEFEVGAERTSYSIESLAGRIEASIDCGSIQANGMKLEVRELELELKSGAVSAVFNLARKLVSQAPLQPNPISKAERGHLLAQGAWARPAKSSKPRIRSGMSCRLAFQEICRAYLGDFFLNVPAIEQFGEAEGVHQGRVAIRRLRAALTLFKPMVFDIAYRRLRGELKWLAGSLGEARDLDVLQANLRQLLPEKEASELASRFEARRLSARHAIVESLNSERGRTLLLELLIWIEDGRWHRQPSPIRDEPVQEFVRAQLKKRLGQLVKQSANLEDLSAGARHEIRIEAKKLRYMAEPFASVRGVAKDRGHFKALINCCEKLQDSLGAIRDQEAVAEFMLNEVFADEGQPSGAGAKTALFPARLPPLQGGDAKELRKAAGASSKLAALTPF